MNLLGISLNNVLVNVLLEDKTVPGTTDGIMLMGILIVLIIVVPIVWTRRKWMR
jgi:hypothetical protein